MFAVSASRATSSHGIADRMSRLETAIDRKSLELQQANERATNLEAEVSRLRGDNDRLLAENEALQIAINEMKNGSQITARSVMAEISALRGIPLKTILSTSRKRAVLLARHEAIYEVARRCPWMSTPEIGKVFGRDHTTIIHALTYWPDKASRIGISVLPLGREEGE